jgi:hypothetical protein
MSTNPPSFRLPFALKDDFSEDVHPEVQEALRAINHAIRYSFNGLVDVSQAVPVILSKIPAASGPGTAGAGSGNVIGQTNDQTGQSAYTVQDSDYGALVVVNNAGGVALGLNANVKRPFYSRIKVDSGSGAAIITPTLGTINNAGFIKVAAGTTVEINLNTADLNWRSS